LHKLETVVAQTETAAGSTTIKIKDLAIAMFLDSLLDRNAAVRSAIEIDSAEADVETITAFKDMKKTLIAEEDRQRNRADQQKPGFAANVTQVCPHERIISLKSVCWTCDPSKHPKHLVCADCKENGHRSKRSLKCNLFNNTTGVGHPSGFGGLAHNSGGDHVDEEEWIPLRPNFAGVATNKRQKQVVMFDYLNKRKDLGEGDLRHKVVGRANVVQQRVAIDSGCSQTLMSNKGPSKIILQPTF
jgi:hypothetical protein